MAGPKGEAEAADFVMVMGPPVRVLPGLSAAQRENVRATLGLFQRAHHFTRRRFACRELGGPGARLTRRLSAASPVELPGRGIAA